MALIRLQKMLADAGVCSRRRAENYMRQGRVQVNGQVADVLGTKVDPERDVVTVDGRRIHLDQQPVYLALNKPSGYVTTCRQPGRRTIMELVKVPQRIFPVGRLDKDSTGLLLLTNDGRLHLRLSHPSFDHEKEYVVTVSQPISDSALNQLAKGIRLKGRLTRPAIVRRRSEHQFAITLKEGRNRQIRRMVRNVGHQVVGLKRIRMANIRLGRLASGKWRHLTRDEVSRLLSRLDRKKRSPAPPTTGGQ